MLGSFDAQTGMYDTLDARFFGGLISKETLGRKCTRKMVDDILHHIPFSHFHPDWSNDPFEKWFKDDRYSNGDSDIHLKTTVIYDQFQLWERGSAKSKVKESKK